MEIIEQTPIKEVPLTTTLIAAGIIIGLLFIVILISYIFIRKHSGNMDHLFNVTMFAGIVAVILAFLFSCFGATIFSKETGRYKYVVIISEDYPAIELFENYENISYDGEYYYFEDKNDS